MHAMDIVQQQNEMKYCFFMATTWMNLENILSKKKKKANHKKPHLISCHLHEIPRIGQSKGTESRLVIA